MKESYVEGLASYGGPESCVHIREGVGEALTGERAGRVSSRVIHAPRIWSGGGRGAGGGGGKMREGEEGMVIYVAGVWGGGEVGGAEAGETCRRPHRGCRIGKAVLAPARSQTPRMRGNISHGNREIPRPSGARREARAAPERIVKPEGVRR